MEIYLVGGAVRDFLLLHDQHAFLSKQEEQHYWNTVEKDWVVVGATPQEMLAKGFRQVGKSFPVFLHPETHEEYALARTERKVGQGYTGFECYADPDVTLEEDLQRRDLTINAIALKQVNGEFLLDNLIDPYKGVIDLQNRVFRHVSPAFIEDPVRILRVARFACRFPAFTVAPETLKLMQEMVTLGEVDALVAERVWQEWSRSLKQPAPWRWFQVLEDCGAKAKLFPGLNIPGEKLLLLKEAVAKRLDDTQLFAIEVYDLAAEQLEALVKAFRIPNEFSDLAFLVAKHYEKFQQRLWTADAVLRFFESTDAFRRPVRFQEFLKVLTLIAHESIQIPNFEHLLSEVLSINNQHLLAAGYKGELFARELRAIRLKVIEKKL